MTVAPLRPFFAGRTAARKERHNSNHPNPTPAVIYRSEADLVAAVSVGWSVRHALLGGECTVVGVGDSQSAGCPTRCLEVIRPCGVTIWMRVYRTLNGLCWTLSYDASRTGDKLESAPLLSPPTVNS